MCHNYWHLYIGCCVQLSNITALSLLFASVHFTGFQRGLGQESWITMPKTWFFCHWTIFFVDLEISCGSLSCWKNQPRPSSWHMQPVFHLKSPCIQLVHDAKSHSKVLRAFGGKISSHHHHPRSFCIPNRGD